jgi:hypothetical protein
MSVRFLAAHRENITRTFRLCDCASERMNQFKIVACARSRINLQKSTTDPPSEIPMFVPEADGSQPDALKRKTDYDH